MAEPRYGTVGGQMDQPLGPGWPGSQRPGYYPPTPRAGLQPNVRITRPDVLASLYGIEAFPQIVLDNLGFDDGSSLDSRRAAIVHRALTDPRDLPLRQVFDLSDLLHVMPEDEINQHYAFIMLQLDRTRTPLIEANPKVLDYWEGRREELRQMAVRQQSQEFLAESDPTRPENLTKAQVARAAQDNRRAEIARDIYGRFPRIAPDATLQDVVDAQKVLADALYVGVQDPRINSQIDSDIVAGFRSFGGLYREQLESIGDAMYKYGEDAVNKGIAMARLKIAQNRFAVYAAESQARQELGMMKFVSSEQRANEKFRLSELRAEEALAWRQIKDAMMVDIAQQHADQQYQLGQISQRRQLEEHGVEQYRLAGENFAELYRRSVESVAEHARSLDTNMLKYGGNLVPPGQYQRGYEPGGSSVELLRRIGLNSQPIPSESLPQFRTSMDLDTMAAQAMGALRTHPYLTGLPRADVEGLPYSFEMEPRGPTMVPGRPSFGGRGAPPAPYDDEGGDLDEDYEEVLRLLAALAGGSGDDSDLWED